MTAPAAVRLDIHREQLIENLRYAFASRLSVIGELLQNARRAGATRIDIHHDPDAARLTVEDDGAGCENLQHFLRIAESGWDAAIQAEDRPFGMGFLSALFAGESVTVESRRQRMAFRTEDALSFRDIPVEAIPERAGTLVTIDGFRLERFEERVRDVVRGFPVAVSLNGIDLPRPHALGGALRFEATALGLLHLHDIHSEPAGRPNLERGGHLHTVLYLQGLPLARPCTPTGDNRQLRNPNILHLDGRVFRGRMPDRDRLEDEMEAYARIAAFVTDYWCDTLRRAVPTLDPLAVVGTLLQVLERWGMTSLLNGIPYLPGQYLFRFTYPPHLLAEHMPFAARSRDAVSRADIESGKVEVVGFAISDWLGGRFDGDDFADLMYPFLRGNQLGIDLRRLDADHWVRPHLKMIELERLTRHVDGPARTATFSTDWNTVTVVSCERYRLRHDSAEAVGQRDAVFTLGPVFDAAGGIVVKEGEPVVLLPSDCDSAAVVLQVGSYLSDDEYQDREAERDREMFRRFVRELRGETPEAVLEAVLSDLDVSNFASLQGRSFLVAVENTGRIRVRPAGGEGRRPPV